jgi:hypothetical protein
MSEQLLRQVVLIQGRIARAQIRAMGMQAENAHRKYRSEYPAYTEFDFSNLIDDEGISENAIIAALNEAF